MAADQKEDFAILGSYLPTAFSIRMTHPAIGKQPVPGPFQIPRPAFPTFMHEFAHLIQDWSTFRGIIDFLNFWDQVGAVADLSRRSGAEVPYPVVQRGGNQHRLRPETAYALELDALGAMTDAGIDWTKGKSWRFERYEVGRFGLPLAGQKVEGRFVLVYMEEETTKEKLRHRLGAWEIKEAYSVAVGILHGGKPKEVSRTGFEYIVVDRILTHYFDNLTPLHTVAICHWALQDLSPANTLFALIELLERGGRNLPSPSEVYEVGRTEAMGREFERNASEIEHLLIATEAHHASYGNHYVTNLFQWYREHAIQLLHLHLDKSRQFPLDTFLCMDSTGISEEEHNARLEALFKEVHLPLLFWPDGSTYTIRADETTKEAVFFNRCVVDLLSKVWRRTKDAWPCPVYESCTLALKDTSDCKSHPWQKAWQQPTCPYGAAAQVFGIVHGKSFRLTPFPGP
jgi:hypothetical protein